MIMQGEEDRRAEQALSVAIDESLVKEQDEVSLRDALTIGGARTVGIMLMLHIVEQLDRTAITVLAPDIQKAFKVSDTTLLGAVSFAGVFIVLGSIPMAWMADRYSRRRIMNVSTAASAVGMAATAASPNLFVMFLARAFSGGSHSYQLPVFNSLISDAYPIGARARIFSIEGSGRPLGTLIGPIFAGVLANQIGGPSAWRGVLITISVIGTFACMVTFSLREPGRGKFEQEVYLGETFDRPNDMAISMGAAFERMKKIKTFYYICVGIGVLGFALVAVPTQFSLLLENSYHYGAYTRGWIIALVSAPSIIALPLAGAYFDKVFRKDPRRLMHITGIMVLIYGALVLVAMKFRDPVLMVSSLALAQSFTSAGLATVSPIVATVAPPQMRAQAFSLIPIFIFLVGGFFGGILAGSVSDSIGERSAILYIAPPAALIGGLIMLYGSRFVRRDIAMAITDMQRDFEEVKRLGQMDKDKVPLLQVNNIDVSYGTVQILFGVSVEVQKGEVLALLGTNGAGKSTLLRAINGLTNPDRGVIRLNGSAITYAEAEVRAREGIVQVRGGAGTFPSLTVEENLKVAMMSFVDKSLQAERIERVYETFPALRERRNVDARSLSGGQQQMLAVGMCLVLDPKILLIDELSLGLAPIIVQELLAIVQRLKEQGLTMIIVEQSLNVALAFADRAIFIEKGHVRFEGSARELAERDDIVRAVFLGAEGG